MAELQGAVGRIDGKTGVCSLNGGKAIYKGMSWEVALWAWTAHTPAGRVLS